ncbi:hypothetical protein GCM10018793_39020 [Streptomyces sulfonofaciens]|uniref:Uncharacterized protein n=1 Tax=Streptomyces sulfonofaciens TaxID=68272 RepID=A0A919L2Y9_9ACTN|nr:hypothetical protein GCM10018793_39020 [Streptomyces sulfonofaciens]
MSLALSDRTAQGAFGAHAASAERGTARPATADRLPWLGPWGAPVRGGAGTWGVRVRVRVRGADRSVGRARP